MISRRQFLGGASASVLLGCPRGPALRTKQPAITHGVQAGDVQTDRAVVWARCDESARMIVEWSTTASMTEVHRIAGNVVGPTTDHTGWVELRGLQPGQTIVYRVRFERQAARGTSAWAIGRFVMPGARTLRFAWTGDTCGQGFGRNPEWGGLRGYATIRAAEPAFLLHSGDLIYADIGGPTIQRVIHYAPLLDVIDPARATAAEFTPFWEFIAGPIHAGTFGPNPLDPTFGPEVRFQWAPPPGTGNLAPWDGLQSFGTVDVSAEALHVALVGIDGKPRFEIDVPHGEG